MTSYWQPRWKNTVFFGSYRELNYRIDINVQGEHYFRITTNSGPGFELELARALSAPGFHTRGPVPEAARFAWLENESCRNAIASLLRLHFSRLTVRADAIACWCLPAADDLLPEASQFAWCLSLVYLLWSAAPAARRQAMPKSEFIG